MNENENNTNGNINNEEITVQAENIMPNTDGTSDTNAVPNFTEAAGQTNAGAEQANPQNQGPSIGTGPGFRPVKPPMKPWKKGLIICACIFAGLLVIGMIGRSFMPTKYEAAAELPGNNYIAKLTVEGTISSSSETDLFGNSTGYNHSWILNEIEMLKNSDSNTGLLIFVNTPGGGVYESDELYLAIKDYKEETERPVYVAMGSMAASGGYYISAPADKIYANRNTWTGSIGVTMGTMLDVSEFLSRYGVKTETITSGRNKAMGSTYDPMTEEQRQIFQSLIDEAYEQFVGIIAEGRDMDLQRVKTLADGRIYTAKQALDNGLIDEIGTYEDAYDDMMEEYDLHDSSLLDLTYATPSRLSWLFGQGIGNGLSEILSTLQNLGKGDVGTVLDMVTNQQKMQPMYIYQG